MECFQFWDLRLKPLVSKGYGDMYKDFGVSGALSKAYNFVQRCTIMYGVPRARVCSYIVIYRYINIYIL